MDKILVVGDALIDTNIVGECHRLSPEGPWPILKAEHESNTLGGAANVAAHIVNAGLDCIFAYKTADCGPNPAQNLLSEMLEEKGVVEHPLFCSSRFPIPTKKRILAGHHQICRIDYEDPEPPDKKIQFDWYKMLVALIEKEDISVILLSDYNKGTLTDNLIQMLANHYFSRPRMILLDPKRPSFVKLRRLYLIKPNGREVPATNMTAEEISHDLQQTYLVNTIGKDGVKVWRDGQELFSYSSVAEQVVDVCGAGDAFFALLGIALANGHPIESAVLSGNQASAYAIAHHGTYVLTPDEIKNCLRHFGYHFA